MELGLGLGLGFSIIYYISIIYIIYYISIIPTLLTYIYETFGYQMNSIAFALAPLK